MKREKAWLGRTRESPRANFPGSFLHSPHLVGQVTGRENKKSCQNILTPRSRITHGARGSACMSPCSACMENCYISCFWGLHEKYRTHCTKTSPPDKAGSISPSSSRIVGPRAVEPCIVIRSGSSSIGDRTPCHAIHSSARLGTPAWVSHVCRTGICSFQEQVGMSLLGKHYHKSLKVFPK